MLNGGLKRSPASFLTILEDLYSGALEDEAWNRAMIAITDAVGGSATVLLAFNPSSGALLREENHRLDPSVLDDYRQYWSLHDPRMQSVLAVPVGEPITELAHPVLNWGRSPILNEFLIPADCPHFMPIWLKKSPAKAVALSFQGGHLRGPFDRGDAETLKRFSLHISRALEIRDRLEAAQVRANTLASCIDRVGFGVIALDLDGKILYANALAEKMLREEPAVRALPDRTLSINGVPWRRGLRCATGDGAANPSQPRNLRIERDGGRWPITATVTPPPSGPVSWAGADPAFLIYLFDPETPLCPQVEQVALELGISAREADISVLLSMGLELSAIAIRLSISVHTARTHLKSIYAKTGIRSQTNLVRRVLHGAARHPSSL
jgi:DNA-binding CsgD family transcriptional regulator